MTNISPVMVKNRTFWNTEGHVKVTFSLLLEIISKTIWKFKQFCIWCRVLRVYYKRYMLGLNLVIFTVFKKGLNISNGQPEAVYRKKEKKRKGQIIQWTKGWTMIYKTLHRKLKIEQLMRYTISFSFFVIYKLLQNQNLQHSCD